MFGHRIQRLLVIWIMVGGCIGLLQSNPVQIVGARYRNDHTNADFTYQASRYIGGAPGVWPNAQLIPADFNGDRRTDILVFQPSTGGFAKWYGDSSTSADFIYQASRYIGGAPGVWPNAQLIPADFNNDGRTDILAFRPSTGAFAKWYSDSSIGPEFNHQISRYIGGAPGVWPNAQLMPTDFNGDRRTDILAFRPSTGAFAKWYSDSSIGPEFNHQISRYIGGAPGVWPNAQLMPTDFNNDGQIDILVFQPSTGGFAKWYGDSSTSADFIYQASRYIGGAPGVWPNAQLMPTDFNNDGRTDILVFQPSTGGFAKWYGATVCH